ncbi:MAG TPA: hypothetical protein VFF06_07805 [Polyangia bacterium]|nr:hypothetical protein [Polyangia bacterium]
MRALPWVLLCASLSLNALLMMSLRATPVSPAGSSREPSSAAPPDPFAASPARAPKPPRPFASFAPPASAPPTGKAPASAPPGEKPPLVDDALIQDVLCTVAENRMREGWRRDRDGITQGLRRSLADRAEQEANAAQNGAELATLLDVPARDRDDFQRRYRERRLARVAAALSALDGATPDYAALMAAAQGLFADEDALARELGGQAGFDRVRAAELEGRTTFLAITAALADAPDRSIRW